MKHLIITAALMLVPIVPAAAQEAPGLPPICTANAGMDHGAMGSDGSAMAPSGDEAHQALMAGMDKMNSDMMAAGTATDIDVAFVCSMIPHHRGAIDMAKAELQYGDDEWAKTLAQQIIDAQEKELADMLAWLETQPQ